MSTLIRLEVPQYILEEMIQHGLMEAPNECCGLMAGQIVNKETGLGRVSKYYPLVNEAASPIEFCSEPKSMFLAVKDMRSRQLSILAVYHSHPSSDPIPSRTDCERAYGPGIMNFILSVKATPPTVRAWWIEENSFQEAQWEIINGTGG